MHPPISLFFTFILTLFSLTPSTNATPAPQTTNELIDPITEPDFSRCNFIQIIRSTIEGPFTLTAISDTLPLQSWPVQLRSPSAKEARSPYISRTRIAQPLLTLVEGSLNATGLDGRPYPGRFVENKLTNPLQRFLFGGRGVPSEFYWIQNCDATGTPYAELKAGRDLLVKSFSEGANIFGQDVDDINSQKYTKIHLRINA